MQVHFGAGALFGTPTQDAFGAAIANPTPIKFGVLQDISLDISFDLKELYGQNQFPIAIGRGKGKITGKAKQAQVNGAMLNSLVFGQTLANGILSDVNDVTGSLIPATPFQIPVVPPSSGTWANDLGVTDLNGVPYTRVVSGPIAGQYSVATGTYTFAAADTGKTVLINYQYTATSTVAKKSTVVNLPMGYAPTFKADFYNSYNSKNLVVSCAAATTSKFSLATKLDDFMIPELDFSCFQDASGNVLTYSLSE